MQPWALPRATVIPRLSNRRIIGTLYPPEANINGGIFMKQESKILGIGVIAVFVALVAVAAIHSINVQAADTNYRVVENWAQLPNGGAWGTMSAVDIDPRNGTIYVFQRSEPASIMA